MTAACGFSLSIFLNWGYPQFSLPFTSLGVTMKKLLGVFALAILTTGISRADIGIPKDMRLIPTDHKIETETDFTDFNFFIISGEKITAVKLAPKTPLLVTSASMHPKLKVANLVAVPKDAQKGFKTPAEFQKALREQKVTGALTANTVFSGTTAVKLGDKRASITERWTVDKVNDKDGILLTPVAPKEKEKDKNSGDADEFSDDGEETNTPSAFAPRGSGLIAGLAATVAVTLTGLWLTGRRRRNLA